MNATVWGLLRLLGGNSHLVVFHLAELPRTTFDPVFA
jgi:hypothetical protein